MPASIQEWLTGIGFQMWPLSEVFERAGVRIPYTELAGHTVATFKEKAKRKGWVTEEEATRTKRT